MLTVDVLDVQGFGPAIRGMRNPMNSWDKSDSHICNNELLEIMEDCQMVANNHEPACECNNGKFGFCIGHNDLDLMQRLFQAGTEHRKFARMIQVYMNITAPLYWWKEFDTYKVGTVCNSCSTMHKIHSKEFTLDDFSHEHLYWAGNGGVDSIVECADNHWLTATGVMELVISTLNLFRERYLKTKNKDDWWQMIQLLPTSYNQTRTVMLSYENAFTIRRQRKNHKLDEWHILSDALLNLPYYREITGEE